PSQPARLYERVEHARFCREQLARLVDLADDDTRTEPLRARFEGKSSERGREERALATAVRPDDGDSFRPPDLDVDRPEPEVASANDGTGEARHDCARSGRG